MPGKSKRVPADLGPAGRRFWARVNGDFELSQGDHLETLEIACRALDRAARARKIIEEMGEVVVDRWTQPRTNPACAVERDAMRLYLSACRQLGLDIVPSTGIPGRPSSGGR